MKEVRELTCICCPLGCAITVEMEAGQILSVTGNTCLRGHDYACKEVTNPTRIVTSTVKVVHGQANVTSVKTQSDIPKDKIFACMAAIKQSTVIAPVHIGDVVIENVVDTGVNVIATKPVDAA